jgi:hypothetical protein
MMKEKVRDFGVVGTAATAVAHFQPIIAPGLAMVVIVVEEGGSVCFKRQAAGETHQGMNMFFLHQVEALWS